MAPVAVLVSIVGILSVGGTVVEEGVGGVSKEDAIVIDGKSVTRAEVIGDSQLSRAEGVEGDRSNPSASRAKVEGFPTIVHL